ncbi:MAG: RadC family protein [Thermodesulfobacteriota bacterium]
MSRHDKPQYLGHRRRLKSRFESAPESLPDYEILELLLGYALPQRDTKPIAKRLLERFGTLSSTLTASREALMEVEGVGPGIVLFLNLLQETRARQEEGALLEREILSSPERVARLARERFGRLAREEFWVALVDNKNRLCDFTRVFTGTVDQTAVYPREVLRLALTKQASGVILVHNHPGGDPTPSPQDKDLTHRLRHAAQELGVRILDHVIVSEASFFSFQSSGLL